MINDNKVFYKVSLSISKVIQIFAPNLAVHRIRLKSIKFYSKDNMQDVSNNLVVIFSGISRIFLTDFIVTKN